MPIFRLHHNWGSLRDLEQEVDELLRHVQLGMHGLRVRRQFPGINIYEAEGEYLLTAELPGTKLEDLDLSVADGVLTLKGVRDDLSDVSENAFRRNERFRGAWQRQVSLPERVLEEELSATFTNGVLRIRLPKAPEAAPRKIHIETEPSS